MDSRKPAVAKVQISGNGPCVVSGDNATGQPIEPEYEPSIVLVEDPAQGCSGPIALRGGV